jgi:creatinine amidohydrolase
LPLWTTPPRLIYKYLSIQEVHMTRVCYADMLPNEAIAARERLPLAYLPIGPLEWHGPHAALGLDPITARELAILAAERGGGVVMPTVWWGEPREIMLVDVNADTRDEVIRAMRLPPENFHKGFLGGKTVEAQGRFYNELLLHCYHQIASLGFRAIFVVVGHLPLTHFVHYTAQIFMRESPARVYGVVPATLIQHLARDLGGRVGDHAGRWETSVLMALRPELVALQRLDPDRGTWPAAVGGEDPRDADVEFGRRAVAAMVAAMLEKARELLKQAGVG